MLDLQESVKRYSQPDEDSKKEMHTFTCRLALRQKHMKVEEIGYAGKCRDRELCALKQMYVKTFLKMNKDIPFHIFPFCPLLENSMRRVRVCKTEAVLYLRSRLHLPFQPFAHVLISWQRLSRLLFLARCVPPSYSIQDVTTLSLLFTFYPTNFLKDRDLLFLHRISE